MNVNTLSLFTICSVIIWGDIALFTLLIINSETEMCGLFNELTLVCFLRQALIS